MREVRVPECLSDPIQMTLESGEPPQRVVGW